MNCRQLLDALGDYLDQEITVSVRREIEQHCHRCHKCWLLLETCRKTVAVYEHQEPPELPAAVHDRLMKAVLRIRRDIAR
ncbi:MAG TPA: hypothetical protein VE996_01445 [Terriglobales bacterium]|nr:hypothetical protein [Terriglobales bacterium]